jgi:multidrug efflux pump subunit AcrA (membrane-fusion protein)
MKKTVFITAIVVVLTSLGLTVFVRMTSGNNYEELNTTLVNRGDFEIVVSGSGELLAERSTDIKGPNIVQNMNFRVAPVKIFDLVPEGTIVKQGDYIGSLERTNFNNTLKDEQEILRRLQSELEMKLYDTAMILSTVRDEIRDQMYSVEEAAIELDMSKYEPPAVQRQVELDLDKSRRFLDYKRRLYLLRFSQSSAEVRNLKSNLDRQKRKVDDLQQVLATFTIKAPADGMVTYKKDRMGNKIKSGSFMNPFDPVVATLPDLSSMISKIYVSETEVTKIRTGLPVKITVDALSDRVFEGKVSSIANIGEMFSNSDSKVFEVLVRLDNTALKPSMTSGNRVILKNYSSVLYVPVECVQAGADSIPYVFTKDGTKQIVVLGESNDKNIIIEQGLNDGTELWLSAPENQKKFVIAGSELIPVIRDREKVRRLRQEQTRIENKLLTDLKKSEKGFTLSSGSSGASGVEGGL